MIMINFIFSGAMKWKCNHHLVLAIDKAVNQTVINFWQLENKWHRPVKSDLFHVNNHALQFCLICSTFKNSRIVTCKKIQTQFSEQLFTHPKVNIRCQEKKARKIELIEYHWIVCHRENWIEHNQDFCHSSSSVVLQWEAKRDRTEWIKAQDLQNGQYIMQNIKDTI